MIENGQPDTAYDDFGRLDARRMVPPRPPDAIGVGLVFTTTPEGELIFSGVAAIYEFYRKELPKLDVDVTYLRDAALTNSAQSVSDLASRIYNSEPRRNERSGLAQATIGQIEFVLSRIDQETADLAAKKVRCEWYEPVRGERQPLFSLYSLPILIDFILFGVALAASLANGCWLVIRSGFEVGSLAMAFALSVIFSVIPPVLIKALFKSLDERARKEWLLRAKIIAILPAAAGMFVFAHVMGESQETFDVSGAQHFHIPVAWLVAVSLALEALATTVLSVGISFGWRELCPVHYTETQLHMTVVRRSNELIAQRLDLDPLRTMSLKVLDALAEEKQAYKEKCLLVFRAFAAQLAANAKARECELIATFQSTLPV